MKLVRENIEFKRGLDPGKSLGIGENREILDPSIDDILNLSDGDYFMISTDYPWFGILEIDGNVMRHYEWQKTKDKVLLYKKDKLIRSYAKYTDGIKRYLNTYIIDSMQKIDLDIIQESSSFKRGLDAKKALNIGRYNVEIGDRISFEHTYYHTITGIVKSIEDEGPKIHYYDSTTGVEQDIIAPWDDIKKINRI